MKVPVNIKLSPNPIADFTKQRKSILKSQEVAGSQSLPLKKILLT